MFSVIYKFEIKPDRKESFEKSCISIETLYELELTEDLLEETPSHTNG
jgi:hypothetical protein